MPTMSIYIKPYAGLAKMHNPVQLAVDWIECLASETETCGGDGIEMLEDFELEFSRERGNL